MAADELEGNTRDVPVIWIDWDAEPILFANVILAQHMNDEFIISFGQASPPVLMGSEEERREALANITAVPVKAVARIGVTPQRMREFLDAMWQNLERYEHTGENGE